MYIFQIAFYVNYSNICKLIDSLQKYFWTKKIINFEKFLFFLLYIVINYLNILKIFFLIFGDLPKNKKEYN